MNDLHLNVLPEIQQALFQVLAKNHFIEKFYLAGGTALALRLGHRQSVDFDFFAQEAFDNREIIDFLFEIGDFKVLSQSKNTVHGLLNGVQVSFLGYQYPLLDKFDTFDRIRLASIRDIAAMKISAIASRGGKKDFIDFHFLSKHFPLREMLDDYHQKDIHGNLNDYQLLKSLVFFIDAETDPMPLMLKKVNWEAVKHSISDLVALYQL